jgi:hypothetical protein
MKCLYYGDLLINANRKGHQCAEDFLHCFSLDKEEIKTRYFGNTWEYQYNMKQGVMLKRVEYEL